MTIDRRQLLIGGGAGVGLLLGWAVWPRSYKPNLVADAGESVFNAFLKIGTDGHIAVIVPQAEMGQGVWTSLPQILADELGADWRTIAVEPSPIGPLYANDFLIREAAGEMAPAAFRGLAQWAGGQFAIRSAFMITGGSSSVRGFEARYRAAGAQARALLCMAAARRWDAAWDACDTAAGFVTRGTDKLRFGELAAEAAGMTPPADVPLRLTGEGGISGQSVPRIDLPSKVDGTARFAGDVRLPDMLYASVRHGPFGDTRLAGIDRAAAEKVHGVRAVFENPGWAAAVATNWWAAEQAAEALNARFVTQGKRPDSASIDAALRSALETGAATRFAVAGDLDAAFAGAKGYVREYKVPLAVHAAIEPMTATARVSGDRLKLWMPTQAPGMARRAAANAIGFSESQVTVYPMFIGGGFGRKVESDAAAQAAILAAKMKRPVQVVWSRAEETIQDRFRPPALARLTAVLGASGTIAGWQARIAAPSASSEMLARFQGKAGGGRGKAEPAAVEGAVPPYRVGALAVDHLPVDIGVPTGIWRSVANSYTAFFTECFVDELARQAGIEPFSFRMQMLGSAPRLARCLTMATAIGGWDGGGEGSVMGIAAHSSFGSHVAVLAEAGVEAGRIIVRRIVAVADCGRVINPDIVLQQIEGGILWGLAAALGSSTGMTDGVADARNFDALNLPILATTPQIRVELIRSREEPGGVGEVAVSPVAPAIANAIYAGTRRRLRSLPLTV